MVVIIIVIIILWNYFLSLTFCFNRQNSPLPKAKVFTHLLNPFHLPSPFVNSAQCQAVVTEGLHKGQFLQHFGNIYTNPASQGGVCNLRLAWGP